MNSIFLFFLFFIAPSRNLHCTSILTSCPTIAAEQSKIRDCDISHAHAHFFHLQNTHSDDVRRRHRHSARGCTSSCDSKVNECCCARPGPSSCTAECQRSCTSTRPICSLLQLVASDVLEGSLEDASHPAEASAGDLFLHSHVPWGPRALGVRKHEGVGGSPTQGRA